MRKKYRAGNGKSDTEEIQRQAGAAPKYIWEPA